MTPEEAREELKRRLPGTVCAHIHSWWRAHSNSIENVYGIYYNFNNSVCSGKHGTSFEDCFFQLDQDNESVNALLKKDSILLRQFTI